MSFMSLMKFIETFFYEDNAVDDKAGDLTGDGNDNGNDDKTGDYKVDDPTASCLGLASGLILISTPVRGESFGSK